MTDAFISYSRKDQAFVRQIADLLTSRERDVWVDWEDIPLTADWWQQIQQGIEGSDSFIFISSANSLGSVVCHLELAHALQHNKRLIPVVVVEMPDERLTREQLTGVTLEGNLLQMLGTRQWDELVKSNWQQLSRHNWLIFNDSDDAASFDANAEKLIEALDTDPSHVNQHTRLLVRALEWDKRNRDTSFLLNGSEITEAESWLTQGLEKEPLPTQLQAEYISASRMAANRRQRSLFAGTAVALVATIGLAILAALFGVDARQQSEIAQTNAAVAVANENTALANQQRADQNASTATVAQGLAQVEADNAATQAAIAEENASTAVAERDRADEQARLALSRQLAAQSDALLEDDLETAMLLAVEAQRTANTYEAQDSLLRALEARTQITQYLSGHASLVRSLAISPDGRYIASGGDDTFIRVWEAATGRGYGLPLEELGQVNALYFTEDNHLLAATTTETLTEWDIATGQIVSYRREGVFAEATNMFSDIGEFAAAFTADGRYIVTASTSNEIQLLDTTTGELVLDIQEPEGSMLDVASDPLRLIDTIAIQPQEKYVASTSGSQIKLFRLTGGESELLFDVQNIISANGAFSPDGRYYAWYRYPLDETTGAEATAASSIEVVDLETGETIRSIPLGEVPFDFVTSMIFDDDSQRVFLGSDAGQIRAIDIMTGETVIPVLDVFVTDIRTLAFDDTRNRLIVGGNDGRIALIDLDVQSQLARLVNTDPFDGTLENITFCTGDSVFAVTADERDVYIMDYLTGKQVLAPFTPYEDDSVESIALHPTEDLLATLSLNTDEVRLWDFSSGTFELVLGEEHLDSSSVLFSPDGRWLISHGLDDEVLVWDVQQRAFLYGANTVIREGPFSLVVGGNPGAAFHPSGDYLLTVGFGLREIHAWSMNEEGFTLLPDITFEIPDELASYLVFDLAFSPDGRRLAAALLDGYLLLWDTETGDLITEAVQIGGDGVQSIAFEPDGRTLAITTNEEEVFLFDSETGRRFGAPLHVQAGGFINDIAFTANGQELIGLSGDRLYAWPFDVELWARTACRRVNTVWDQVTWSRIVGDVPYRITCPEVALTQADELVLREDTEQAEALFTQLSAATDIQENAGLQTAICRVGALGNLPEPVMPACDRAVALAPDQPMALESRAVANSLVGNYELAAADLRQMQSLEEESEPQVDTWLLSLDAGNNPFDTTIRRNLRNDFAENTAYLLTSVADLEVIPDYILLSPDEITTALDDLYLPFYPLTFSDNVSPLSGWSITRTDEVDYEAIGPLLRNDVVPGARGLRILLTKDQDTEQFIAIIESDGPYDTLDDWMNDLGMLADFGDSEQLEINGVEIVHRFNEGGHYYFFIDKGVHTAIVYYSEFVAYDAEIATVITDLTRD